MNLSSSSSKSTSDQEKEEAASMDVSPPVFESDAYDITYETDFESNEEKRAGLNGKTEPVLTPEPTPTSSPTLENDAMTQMYLKLFEQIMLSSLASNSDGNMNTSSLLNALLSNQDMTNTKEENDVQSVVSSSSSSSSSDQSRNQSEQERHYENDISDDSSATDVQNEHDDDDSNCDDNDDNDDTKDNVTMLSNEIDKDKKQEQEEQDGVTKDEADHEEPVPIQLNLTLRRNNIVTVSVQEDGIRSQPMINIKCDYETSLYSFTADTFLASGLVLMVCLVTRVVQYILFN